LTPKPDVHQPQDTPLFATHPFDLILNLRFVGGWKLVQPPSSSRRERFKRNLSLLFWLLNLGHFIA
jgi:hypothetical protein